MTKKKQRKQELIAEKSELAMIEGVLEGSPDGIGVAVVRLNCGCRKMAAVDKNGDPASKVITYRDNAQSVCDLCKQDNGAFIRVTQSFIHFTDPPPPPEEMERINVKVLGSATQH